MLENNAGRNAHRFARLQVLSRRQLLSAVFKAVTSAAHGALKTPNVHSEIVLSLNPSNNVSSNMLAAARPFLKSV